MHNEDKLAYSRDRGFIAQEAVCSDGFFDLQLVSLLTGGVGKDLLYIATFSFSCKGRIIKNQGGFRIKEMEKVTLPSEQAEGKLFSKIFISKFLEGIGAG